MNIEPATHILNCELGCVDGTHPIGLKDAIRAVLAKLTELQRPDGFWDDDDPDESHESVGEAVEGASVGAVVKIGQYHHLSYIFAVVHRNADDEDDSHVCHTEEEAKAWKAEHFPEEPSE